MEIRSVKKLVIDVHTGQMRECSSRMREISSQTVMNGMDRNLVITSSTPTAKEMSCACNGRIRVSGNRTVVIGISETVI